MWQVGWWNRIYFLVDPTMAILDGLILILMCRLVHVLTKKLCDTNYLVLVTIHFINQLLPGRWWRHYDTLLCHLVPETPARCFEAFVLFYCMNTRDICVVLIFWWAQFQKRYRATLYVPHRTGVCLEENLVYMVQCIHHTINFDNNKSIEIMNICTIYRQILW